MTTKNQSLKTPRACGTWPSPISADLLAGKVTSFSNLSSYEGKLYWLERGATHQGRTVLMCFDPIEGNTHPVFSFEVNIGTRVHEYGGGGYVVGRNGFAFIDKKSSQVCLSRDGKTETCIADATNMRFAGLCFDHNTDGIFAVREDHNGGEHEPTNSIVLLGEKFPQEGQVICKGADFYMNVCVSKDGQWLSWIEWDHPFMPWDGTRLCVARIRRDASGQSLGVEQKIIVADGMREKSKAYLQPQWGHDGRLFFITEKNNFWGIWVCDPRNPEDTLEAYFTPENAEIGQPPWVFGQSSYQLLENNRCIAVVTRRGEDRIYIRHSDGKSVRFYGRADQCPVPLDDDLFGWIALSQTDYPKIVIGDGDEKRNDRIVRTATLPAIAKGDISCAERVDFAVQSHAGLYGRAFFYPALNTRYCPLASEKPPMIVQVHGGPTACVKDNFSLKVQKWTSRGIAVLNVNYGGSTGFGRQWRRRLNGQWGIVDVDDCIDAVRHMITTGRIDPRRIAIRGSSSGGMSVFLALAKSPLFVGGVSAYGVTDLCGLQEDTHKFEAHYNDSLIGRWPEEKSLYIERSPLSHAGDIHVPVLLLHGDADKVVPIKQARLMMNNLKKAGVHCSLKEYAGAGHGFRQPQTIKDAFERELAFYGSVFHFNPDNERRVKTT